MGTAYDKQMAKLTDFVGIDDAESLLEWVQSHPKGQIDLTDCAHLHAANLQVLMAAKLVVSHWPQDAQFTDWLKSVLQKQGD